MLKFYVAGYYLIQSYSKPEGMDARNLLPVKIWSGSSHICQKIPDAWILSWVNDPVAVRQREEAKAELRLSPIEFSVAQKDFDELFREDRFGFPNVFMDSDALLEKSNKFFRTVLNRKLIGLALPETYIEDFLEEYDSPGFEPVRRNGIYVKLSQKEVYKGNTSMGYDLLCFTGGDYCSFLCSRLEDKMHDEYGVQYNQYGLISDFESADRVSQAIARGEAPAEEGYWAPWLMFELTI
jgi:hypothetical protein